MRLYGKNTLKERLDAIAAKDHLPHAIMLYGEKGTGRRVMANYIAKLFMCGAAPCEECPTCSKINANAHPDVIFVKKECGGKYGLDESKGGQVSIRRIMESVVVKPNDGNVKVYVFEDSDEMSVQIQNTLLKLIEEPAPFLRFVFTCENTDSIIETIRSRVTEFEVPRASAAECAQMLIDSGHPAAQAKELAETLSGNIGKCLDILSGDGDTAFMETARKAAAAIGRKDAYSLAAALSEQTGRPEFASVLGYLTEILRDALAKRCGGSLTSCGRKEAEAIASACGEEQLLDMLDAIFKVAADAALNLNLALSASYLTTKLI